MKEKIISALKTEYAKMGLGEKAFDGVASFLEKTVSKEEEIEGVIKSEDTRNLLKAIQGESDSLRNRNAQLQRDLEAIREKKPQGGDDPQKPSEPDTEPEWARALREQNEALAARLDRQDADIRRKALISSVRARLESEGCTNKGVLNSTLKGFEPGKDESEDTIVERLKGEYNASYKDTFGDGPAPIIGGQAFGDTKTAVDKKNDFLRQQGLLPNQGK